MNNEERMHKLTNGSDTAIWAHNEIVSLREQLAETQKLLASARRGLEIEKQNERVAEYHRQWDIEEAIEGKY